MSDLPLPTDNSPAKPPAQADGQARVPDHAGASHAASLKGAAEIYGGGKSGPGDGSTPITDNSHPGAGAEGPGSLAIAAQQAWGKDALTSHPSHSVGDAPHPNAQGHFDFAHGSFVSAGEKGSKVVAKDGQVTVDNAGLTATHNTDGSEVVKEKATGESFIHHADNSITDVASDRTTTIAKGHIDDKFKSLSISRDTQNPLPEDGSQPKPGEARQGKDGIAYTDAAGAGTATARNDNTITLQQTNGDQVVLNSSANASSQVTFSEKGGQPQTMSLEQFKAAHGDRFANFKLDSTSHVTDVNDGVVMQAHGGTAALAKTDANTHDSIKASVSADGTSDLTHLNAQGAVVSESTVNYNNPAQAYQQLDSSGKVVANFDANTNTFQGDGFNFNSNGMQIADGDVSVLANGTYSADSSYESVYSDGTYTGDGSLYASQAYDGSQSPDLSTGDAAYVASALQSAMDGDLDSLENIQQLTDGRVDVSGALYRAEKQASWQGRKAERDGRDKAILDFGKAEDIYAA